MDGKTHQHGPYAYRWMAQYRVGFAENFPQITPPDHVLPDNDGFVNWNRPMLWQVGGLKERYLVSFRLEIFQAYKRHDSCSMSH